MTSAIRSEQFTLSPEALHIQRQALQLVKAGVGTPSQVQIALQFLYRLPVHFMEVKAIAKGIITSETKREPPQLIKIAKAYIATKAQLATQNLESQNDLPDPYVLQHIDPMDMSRAMRASIDVIPKIHANFHKVGNNCTDKLVSLTEQVAQEAVKHQPDRDIQKEMMYEAGVLIADMFLHEKRYDEALQANIQYPSLEIEHSYVQKAKILAESIRLTRNDNRLKYYEEAYVLIKSASEVRGPNNITFDDEVRLTLAKGLLKRNDKNRRDSVLTNFAADFISKLSVLKSGSATESMVTSVFGGVDEYVLKVCEVLPDRSVRFLEDSISPAVKELNPERRFAQLRIDFHNDLIDMIGKGEIPFNDEILSSIFINFSNPSNRIHILNRMIEKTTKKLYAEDSKPDKNEVDALNKLLANPNVIDLFKSVGGYLQSETYWNWYSLITTGKPMEPSFPPAA